MTTSTTLKLPEQLKKRIAPLAKSSGLTPHAWMVEAIEAQAARAETRKAFVKDALTAEAETQRSGRAYALADVSSYMRARAGAKAVKRPKPVKW